MTARRHVSVPGLRPLRRVRLLTALEAVAILSFISLCSWIFILSPKTVAMTAINPEALIVGPGQERWMGIFFEDQPVGYAVTQESSTTDGGLLVQGRSVFRMVSFGQIQRIVTEGSAVLDAQRRLRTFEVFWDAGAMRLVARGEVRGDEIVVEVHQGTEVQQIAIPFTEPPQVNLSLGPSLVRDSFTVGQRFKVPYFDPITLTQSDMDVAVTGVEILPNGEEAYWLTTTFSGIESRRLTTPGGETLREETDMGLRTVRMTREEAELVAESDEPADIIAMSSIEGVSIANSREIKTLLVEVGGIAPTRVPHDPPLQVRDGSLVRIQMPLLQEIPRNSPLLREAGSTSPGEEAPPELDMYLTATPTLPAFHPEIVAMAKKIVAGADNRRDAAMLINDWVFTEVEKSPVVGIPNGLEVLRTREGDCNEHTALFVSLARAAGVPARIAAGLVYSDQVTGTGAFYYHAWPEVHLGGDSAWVPLDPTFGEFPADATHIKLVEGDLERQIEIVSVMGRLRLAVKDAR